MMRGVILMAYGTPESPDQVEAYYTHIRGGRAPSPEAVKKLERRYEIGGGRTPLLEITNAVRAELERQLNAPSGAEYRVYVGMKHWHPFIADAVRDAARDGISDIVALALAPHYSRMSVGRYHQAVSEAVSALGAPFAVHAVNCWHMNESFIALIVERITQTLTRWPPNERADVVTLFSAHSLPERIRQWGDPYEDQLLESCRAVAAAAGIANWHFAWQSASDTGEAWLGPDISQVLEALERDGVRHVLSVPIGFVCDHLEILYDLDHEAKQLAATHDLTLHRIPMPNADPAFINVLASIVHESTNDSHAPLEQAS